MTITSFRIWPLALVAMSAWFAGCVHTPPGTSVEIALARRPEWVNVPKPLAPARPVTTQPAEMQPEKTELVADAFSRGEFCMKTGNDTEAIAAFREAVRLDPKFTEAWSDLAALYERVGQDKLAMEAFRKAKAQ